MNTPTAQALQELEEKYKHIHEKRLALKADFLRLDNECKQVLRDLSILKDSINAENIHKKILTSKNF